MASKLQVTPTKLQVTPTKLQVTLTKLQVTPTKLQVTRSKLTSLTAETNKFQLTKARFIRRISVASNAIQTIDNEVNHLIIYCLNCIRRD